MRWSFNEYGATVIITERLFQNLSNIVTNVAAFSLQNTAKFYNKLRQMSMITKWGIRS